MSDLIERQAVLDAFGLSEKTRKYGGDHSGYDTVMLYEIQNIIEDLPSVTPTQMIDKSNFSQEQYKMDLQSAYDCGKVSTELTGHWKGFTHSAYHGVDDDNEPIWREVKVYHCSECNRRTVIKENYCPNCGADMRGAE